MNYREVKNEYGTQTQFSSIIIEREDGSFVSFPADPDNPHYQQFLKDLEVTP